MCWKRHEPDPPQPSPTPMAVFVSSTEAFHGIGNATEESGIRCPHVATTCSNKTSFSPDCFEGICCEHGGKQYCSCVLGWKGDECEIEDVATAQSVASAGSQQMIIGVVIAVLILVGLMIFIFLVFRRKNRSRNSQRNTETSKGLPLSDVTVVPNSASTSLLRNGEDTNNKGAS